jgi:hypothetical protein
MKLETLELYFFRLGFSMDKITKTALDKFLDTLCLANFSLRVLKLDMGSWGIINNHQLKNFYTDEHTA